MIRLILITLLLTGCIKTDNAANTAAKKIVANREAYKTEILAATNECIKNSNTLTSLTAAGNDAAETIAECSNRAQIAYGAYSPWFEQDLLKMAYGNY